LFVGQLKHWRYAKSKKDSLGGKKRKMFRNSGLIVNHLQQKSLQNIVFLAKLYFFSKKLSLHYGDVCDLVSTLVYGRGSSWATLEK